MSPEAAADTLIRRHRNVWKLFIELTRGGYPYNDDTMRLARRSVYRGEPTATSDTQEEGRDG